MNKKLSKFLVTALSILVVSLVAGYLKSLIDVYVKDKNVYKSVLLGMAVMVVVYYPMTMVLNKYFEKLSRRYISNSKKMAKSNTLGMLIGFVIAIFALFICYAKVWYNVDVINDIINFIK